MTLNFPNSPTLDQTYSYGERTWVWNGNYWETANFTVGYTGSIGYTGSTGANGASGAGDFTTLTDTPANYTSQAGKIVLVNATEDGLEFGNLPEGGGTIRSPEVISPNGVTDAVPTPTLVGSAYATVYSADVRDVREFQLTTFADAGYATPVFAASVDADSVVVTPSLATNTQFRWRCRDVAVTGDVSEYSADAVFTTADVFVTTPSLTVEGSPSSVPESPTLTTGAFATTPTGQDTHASTNWIVRLAADDTIVYQSLADTVNLLSIEVPAGNLLANTAYKFQVQHIGATLGVSAVTEVVATTVAVFEIVPLLAIGNAQPPYVQIYNQEIDTFTKLPDPAVLPTGRVFGISFSGDDLYMAVSHTGEPYVTIYKRSAGTFTKLPDPAVLPPGNGKHTSFSHDGTYLAVSHSNSPYVTIYKRSGDTFTKLADLASSAALSGAGELTFSKTGTYFAVTHSNSPYVTIYKRSGDTFTKLANPAALPPNETSAIAFSSDDLYLAVGHFTSPFITIYKRSGDTFTKLANPAVLPPNLVQGTGFSNNGTYLAVSHNNSPYVTIYKRSSDTFTKLADPAALPTGTAIAIAFSSDDLYLAVGHTIAPYVNIYKRSGDTFTKLADPDVAPTSGNSDGLAFSNTGFPQ